MTEHPFDRATTLHGADAGTARGEMGDDYWAFVGPYGGCSSAIVLRAVLDHPQRIGEPLSLTVNFCAPLAKGPFDVLARAARTNRSTQHWNVDVVQGGETVLTGSVVTAERRESFSHSTADPPAVAAPETLDAYSMGSTSPNWVKRYEFRFAHGAPRTGKADTGDLHDPSSHLWLRDAPPRPLDYLSLASMADAFFGRIFHVQGRIVPFGTVSLTTYFLGDADEIARQGDRFLLGVADAKRFHRSYSDQAIELWSADGALLATSVQVAYFKT